MDLIVVPGHASFADHITEVPPDPQADEHWVLQAFQTGEPPFYIEHIKIGVDQLKLQPQARLYFSGGRSRAASHWSEAGTYDKIASHFNFWKTSETEKHDLNERTFTEEYARDSFENLLFSLCAFYQRFNTYPQIVTVVGWAFKQARFDFHRQTLGIPADRFRYIGANNPDDLTIALQGEEKALEQFRADPWGKNPPLSFKRTERNPFGIVPPYPEQFTFI